MDRKLLRSNLLSRSLRESVRRWMLTGAVVSIHGVALFFQPMPTHAQTGSRVVVAPNLMIIFGNSFSMNRKMNDTEYPDIGQSPTCPNCDDGDPSDNQFPRFNDSGFGGQGTPFTYGAFGDHPDSKLAIAKEALKQVLDSPLSDEINFGFATFRQSFGLRLAATAATTRGTWPLLVPKNDDWPNWDNPTKVAYGRDPRNFEAVMWWRIWVATSWTLGLTEQDRSNKNPEDPNLTPFGPDSPAFIGKGGVDHGKGVIDDDFTKFTDALGETLDIPYQFRHRPVNNACPWPAWPCQAPQNTSDRTWTPSKWDPNDQIYTVFNATGATGNTNPYGPDNPLAIWTLCRTFYDSQSNVFKAFYITEKDVPNNYPGQYEGHDISYGSWDKKKFSFDNGQWTRGVEYYYYCGRADRNFLFREGETIMSEYFRDHFKDEEHGCDRLSNVYKNDCQNDDKKRAYATGIPDYLAGTDSETLGLTRGVLSGWSGETTYVETDQGSFRGEMTASYPSGVADPNRSDRQLISKGWQLTTARHMGVFLDLPDPNKGYVDYRDFIKVFMRREQMSPSGLDYDPNCTPEAFKQGQCEPIKYGRGIAASNYAWDDTQSPVYDSLYSAYAYFKSYKAQDPYDGCRSNHILLIYDGREDAHPNPGGDYKNPADVAKALLEGGVDLDGDGQAEEGLGVQVHIIIISNRSGDIAQANAIARAGGTGSAYVVQNADALLEALKSVIGRIRGEIVQTPLAITLEGDRLYVATYDTIKELGHLYAFEFDAQGRPGQNPLWDVEDKMTAAIRRDRLYSHIPNGDIVRFIDLDDAAFNATGSPDVQTIKAFTIDPTYQGGAYLAGRGTDDDGSHFLGRFSHPSMKPVLLPLSGKTLLLFHNDSGFLYAVDASSGDLEWGWIPRPWVAHLRDYSVFWRSGYMAGGVSTLSIPKNHLTTHYVFGTAKKGELHYALELNGDGSLEQVLWVVETPGKESPHAQAPTLFERKGHHYAAFTVVSGSQTEIHLWQVGSSSGPSVVKTLPFKVTTPLIYDDIHDGLFVGSDNKIYRLEFQNGQLKDPQVLTTIEKIGTPIRSFGFYTYLQEEYLWARTDRGILVFKQDGNGWNKLWESHAGGAGKWSNGTYQTVSDQDITPLDPDAEITADPLIAQGILFLPVRIKLTTSTLSCSIGEARLVPFRLTTGGFPTGRILFYEEENRQFSWVTGKKVIGKGKVFQPSARLAPGSYSIHAASETRKMSTFKLTQILRRTSWQQLMP